MHVTADHRIPSLDGLRAVSIGMVIAGHWIQTFFPAQQEDVFLSTVASLRQLGVTIFFVISGFLITGILEREWRKNGTISLKSFYYRRALRIFPAFYFFLIVVAIISALGFFYISLKDFGVAAVYLVDYFPSLHAWPLEHVWSLSVEEQFYLFWPAALIFLLPRNLATKAALLVILTAPLVRLISHYSGSTQLPFMFHTRLDALMFGCLAALALRGSRLERLPGGVVAGCAFLLIFVSPILWQTFGGAYLYLVGYTLEGILITAVLLWVVKNPPRVLNHRLIRHLGTISYSLYLWQQLFLRPQSPFTHPVFSLVGVLLCAEISYFVIERPFLRFRDSALSTKNRDSLGVAAQRVSD